MRVNVAASEDLSRKAPEVPDDQLNLSRCPGMEWSVPSEGCGEYLVGDYQINPVLYDLSKGLISSFG